MTKAYLGDGVYASFDGYQIELRATGEDGRNQIFLEPEVFRALVRFSVEIAKTKEAPNAESESQT